MAMIKKIKKMTTKITWGGKGFILHIQVMVHQWGKSRQESEATPLRKVSLSGSDSFLMQVKTTRLGMAPPTGVWAPLFQLANKTMSHRHAQRPIQKRLIVQLVFLFPKCAKLTIKTNYHIRACMYVRIRTCVHVSMLCLCMYMNLFHKAQCYESP